MPPALRVRVSSLLVGLGLALVLGAASPQGGEFPLSGPLHGDQTAPAVALGTSGGWIAWQDNGAARAGLSVLARRLDENQYPVGSPFRVNATVRGDNEKPQVAMLNNGGAVIVWQAGKPGFQNVIARFVNADGSFATKEIPVSLQPGVHRSAVTTTSQVYRNNRLTTRRLRIRTTVNARVERTAGPGVTVLADGSVVVAYASQRKVTTQSQQLTERVRTIRSRPVTNSVLQAVTATDGEGTGQDIYLQRFTATGEKIGDAVRANQFTSFNQHAPSISARPDGSFVVAWMSELQGQGFDPATPVSSTTRAYPPHEIDIVARAFSGTGEPLADEFMVNSADLPCATPTVAVTPSGGFTVAWTQKDIVHEKSLDIYARTYSASMQPSSDAFLVNTYTRGDQFSPRIASTAAGQLLVWTSMGQDGSREGIFGQWLNDAARVGNEIRVNTTTLLRQIHPAIAAQPGRALVVWASYQTEAAFDVYGQRYITE